MDGIKNHNLTFSRMPNTSTARHPSYSPSTRRASKSHTENFASMDVAEILMYQDLLTPEEMDRVGGYLADKFGIDGYVVNDDVRSPYRTRAVERSAGSCGPAMP